MIVELWTAGMFKYVATIEVPGSRFPWRLVSDDNTGPFVDCIPIVVEWRERHFLLSHGFSDGHHVYNETTFTKTSGTRVRS